MNQKIQFAKISKYVYIFWKNVWSRCSVWEDLQFDMSIKKSLWHYQVVDFEFQNCKTMDIQRFEFLSYFIHTSAIHTSARKSNDCVPGSKTVLLPSALNWRSWPANIIFLAIHIAMLLIIELKILTCLNNIQNFDSLKNSTSFLYQKIYNVVILLKIAWKIHFLKVVVKKI